MPVTVQTMARIMLLGAVFASLQACAPAAASLEPNSVTEAYNTSGVVAVHPYTRTIFSTSNF